MEKTVKGCDGDMCDVVSVSMNGLCDSRHNGYLCTLKKDHAGDHAACANNYHNVAVWDKQGHSTK